MSLQQQIRATDQRLHLEGRLQALRRSASRAVRRGWAKFAVWMRRGIETEHLRELPDYLLADVGLGRSDIDRAWREGGARGGDRPLCRF